MGPTAVGLLLAVALATAAGAEGVRRDTPAIVSVAAPGRLRVGVAGEIRLTYRAPRGDVVAVVWSVEDREAPGLRGSTRQRELGVVARAFGRESGELVVPLSFERAGPKRVILTLVTDEREESEPVEVEVQALP